MAAAMQESLTTEDDAAIRCACGNKISSKDTHLVCSSCLGLQHARAAIETPGSCEHCSRFTLKSLRRRLARQVSLSGQDPLISAVAIPATMAAQPAAMLIDQQPVTATATPAAMLTGQQPPTATRSWGEQLDACAPIHSLPDSEEELELEDGYEGEDPDILLSDEEDEFDDSSFLPSAQTVSQPSDQAPEREAQASPVLSVDLQDVCKRAAEKLEIAWPTVVAEAARSRYEGKRLPRAKRTARQLLPIFPELLDEVAFSWRDKPYTSKTPIQGGSVLDLEGMEKEGLLRMPPMEPLVAAHLLPRRSTTSSPTLPSKADRFQSSMTERAYKAVALSVRALNVTSLLTAYQAELQDEMTANPGQVQWDEICIVTDLSLRLQRCAIQAAGKAMATMVVQERGRWLNLANLSEGEKETILDAPVVPAGIFGSALTLMQKRCEEKKRDDEALQLCLPRKPQPGPPAHSRPPVAQATPRQTAGYRIPRRQRPPTGGPSHNAPQDPKPAWVRKPAQAAAPQAPPPAHSSAGAIPRRKKRQA